MAAAVLPLNVEYYQTMKTTEQARLCVVRSERHMRFLAGAMLWYPFIAVTRATTKFVSLLEEFEAQPASVLLEEDSAKMPEELQELFKKICLVIRKIELVGLGDGLFLRSSINKLSSLSQQIKGYADRFADAQIKLRSRVPEEQVQSYQESFAAYRNCEFTAEPFVEDDKKSQLLRF